ncbi:MAG: hypothetical protein LBE91_06475 [Tannerella sp.]|nr:hypothetical protein [Tannerella sp.]
MNGKNMIMLVGVLVLWLAGYFFLASACPQCSVVLKFLISAFFLILSIFFLMYADKIKKKQYSPRREISMLMMFNFIPLMLTLTIILLYVTLVKENGRLFIGIVAINYVWFLIMKSVILSKIDRKEIKHES